MAVLPKDALVTVRVSSDLLDRFKRACEADDMTVSDVLRGWMRGRVVSYEKSLLVASKAVEYRARKEVEQEDAEVRGVLRKEQLEHDRLAGMSRQERRQEERNRKKGRV